METRPEQFSTSFLDTSHGSEAFFELSLAQKLEDSISHLVDRRVDEYIQRVVKEEDLKSAAESLFKMFLEGQSKEKLLQEIKRVSSQMAHRSH